MTQDWWQKEASLEEALEHGLTQDEYNEVLERIGRSVNMVELGVFAALYSEHCSYKSTKIHLRTLPTEGPRVIEGPGENAGVVDIGDGQAVAFKVESHNHPTFIEPFQGAATGVGGILRDVFTMGARPLALMNALRFGAPENERTPYLLSRAVKGIGTYGNCMGVPTVAGELFFHESYNGNCLVNAFALGLVDTDKIFLGAASGVGNAVFYVGSKTGRDGIHGATMASEEFDDSSEEKRPTVQVGDPFQEKLLLEACLEVMKTGAVVGIQDMGAAGMTSSSYEMASRAGTGLRMKLDKVPQREEGMDPYEIMLSESQERMLVIIEKGKEEVVLPIFSKWDLDAVQVGEVIEDKVVELFWHDKNISTIPVSLVVDTAPERDWPQAEPVSFKENISFNTSQVEEPSDIGSVWLTLLGSVNACSRAKVYEQYDSTVRSNTVVHPGSDSGVIRIKNKSGVEKGVAVTIDCNSRYCSIDPKRGAELTVAEGVRNLAACGAESIGMSDCLNFGSPEKPEGMWQIAKGIEGIGVAARALNVPIVSGNVSLYNETKGNAILPTPMIAQVGLMPDASKALSAKFQNENDVIFVLGETGDELGGSLYLAEQHGIEKGSLPELDYEKESMRAQFVRELVREGHLESCHDISDGGLAIAFAECCFSQYRSGGATLTSSTEQGMIPERIDSTLFSETQGRYIVSVAPSKADMIRERLTAAGIPVGFTGVVGGNKISINEITIHVKEAYTRWTTGLDQLL